ncbi:uncharacterized protein METZ01_LOCUS338521 [marine metagenome]|uniref:DUF502 domain-containing protein n=1 Tax=marine metagenome TaxID=408172 RepID=A0A382QL30_9ZZZZ
MNKKFRYYFLIGLFSILPIAATLWLIRVILSFFAGPAQSIINKILPSAVPGQEIISWIVGFILTFLFVFITGYIVSSVFGKILFSKIESIISRIPIVNSLYQTIKGLTESISNSSKQAFSKVVLIEYPRKGIWTLALVTGESINKEGINFYHLFLPTSPNPTSGYMLYIPKDDVNEIDMSTEEAIKIIVSGGALSPHQNQIKK